MLIFLRLLRSFHLAAGLISMDKPSMYEMPLTFLYLGDGFLSYGYSPDKVSFDFLNES